VQTGAGVRLQIDERSAPFFASLAGVGAPIRGVVELDPGPGGPSSTLRGSDGVAHHWRVLQRCSRVRVRMERPDFSFDGVGYHDTNRGDGRLEASFARWSWARFHGESGRTTILYSVQDRAGGRQALVVDDDQVRTVQAAHDGPLRRAAWGLELPRWFSVDERLRCTPEELLEAAPFYARYTGQLLDGDRVVGRGMGEYLDLDRFRRRGIQFLLRFKTRKVS
jgi:carotenoid 1,2-hydratase